MGTSDRSTRMMQLHRLGGCSTMASSADQIQVDVVLPVYENLEWVHQSICSVRAQTYPHWHLTVVDDASPSDRLAYISQRYKGTILLRFSNFGRK